MKQTKVQNIPMPAKPIGKRTPTAKLASHRKNVAVPIPKPRNCSGKISDRSNHVIGLIAPWKNARKIIIMVMVVNARHEEPAGKRLEKVTPVIAILVPIKPMISNGRRGTCYSNCKVTRVAATAVTPLAILVIKALLRPNPVICKIEVP